MKRLTLALLLIAAPCVAQWSAVQHHDSALNVSSGKLTLGFASNVTIHDLLLFIDSQSTTVVGDTITALSEKQGGTCAEAVSSKWFAGSNRGNIDIWYCVAGATGVDTLFATTTASGLTPRVSIQEFSGNATSSPLDVSAGDTTAFVSAWSSSPFTMATTGDLVVGGTADLADGGNVTISAGSGYTIYGQVSQNTGLAFATEYKTGSATTDSTTFTSTGNAFWVTAGVAFKPSAGGGGAAMGWTRH
jgi:hypothetical protein